MKWLIILTLLFSTAQAQTYTTAKISGYLRDQWRTNDSLRKSNAILKAKLDSAALYLSTTDFIIDPISRTVSLINKPDTFVRVQSTPPLVGFATISEQARNDSNTVYLGDSWPTPAKDKTIEDLKWQVDQYEKLLDERERVIDKLQKIIKNQNNKIAKLTKKP